MVSTFQDQSLDVGQDESTLSGQRAGVLTMVVLTLSFLFRPLSALRPQLIGLYS